MNNETRIFRVGDKVRHFKGGIYKILGVANHTETGESLMICETERGNLVARPLQMFASEVDKEKYPDCKQKYRFEKVDWEVEE